MIDFIIPYRTKILKLQIPLSGGKINTEKQLRCPQRHLLAAVFIAYCIKVKDYARFTLYSFKFILYKNPIIDKQYVTVSQKGCDAVRIETKISN